jgi:hypothetical protein
VLAEIAKMTVTLYRTLVKHRLLTINCAVLALALLISTATAAEQSAKDQPIPVIEMDNVLLTDAIRQLALKARLNILLDPRLTAPPFDKVSVSFRWQDVTAREALEALLANHDLVLVDAPRSSSSR